MIYAGKNVECLGNIKSVIAIGFQYEKLPRFFTVIFQLSTLGLYSIVGTLNVQGYLPSLICIHFPAFLPNPLLPFCWNAPTCY